MRLSANTIPAASLAAGAVCGILLVGGNTFEEYAAVAVLTVAAAVFFRTTLRNLVAFLVCAALFSVWTYVQLPKPLKYGTAQHFAGRVESVRNGPAYQELLARGRCGGVACRMKIRLRPGARNIHYGDSVALRASVENPYKADHVPGRIATSRWKLSQGLSGIMMTDDYRLYHRDMQRGRLREHIDDIITESELSDSAARLLSRACLGESESPDLELRRNFNSMGLSHLLCVSGFHMSVVCGAVMLLAWPFAINRRVRKVFIWLMIGALWVYAGIVGWTPSTVRAAVMATAIALCTIRGQRHLRSNSFFVALLAVLAVSPLWIYSPAFQLSFGAIAGLMVFGTILNPLDKKSGLLSKTISVLVSPVAATLGTMPILLMWFGYIPLAGIPGSIVGFYIFPLFMVLGVVACALDIFCGPANLVHSLMMRMLDGALPYARDFGIHLQLSASGIVLTVVAVTAFAFVLYGRGVWTRVASACVIPLCVLAYFGIEKMDTSQGLLLDCHGPKIEIAQYERGRFVTKLNEHEDIKIADAKYRPQAAHAGCVLAVEPSFRGEWVSCLRTSRPRAVVLHRDIPWRTRSAVRRLCEKSGIEVWDLSDKVFYSSH